MTIARERATLAVLFVGVLIAALDIAIVGPALPAIRGTFAVEAALVAGCLQLLRAVLSDRHAVAREAFGSHGPASRVPRESRAVRHRLLGCRGGLVVPGVVARARDPSVRRRRLAPGRGRRHRRDGAPRTARPDARAHRRRVRRRLPARSAARRVAAALELALAIRDQRARSARAHGGGCAHSAANGPRRSAAFRCGSVRLCSRPCSRPW